MSTFTVRHSVVEDAQQLTQLYAQTPLYSDTLQLPFPTVTRWKERLSQTAPGHFSLVACDGEHIAGQISLMLEQSLRRRHVATFGMGVDAQYQGQGVGSLLLKSVIDLCDNWLQVKRIELTVYADNAAAIALYSKFGFVVEGRSPCYAMRDGALVDTLYMGRLHGV